MELWEIWGYEWSFTWCGVGTRPADLTEEITKVQIWTGHCMALLGGVLCTGDAEGSDYNFFVGYNRGRKPKMPPAQIYFTRKKNQRNLPHDAQLGQHEFEMYPEVGHMAQDMAFEARGSFEGLFPSGIALHSRNALQVLSETLDKPRKYTIFAAKPVGKKGLVKGGTNTAVQISRKNKIPVVNLYVEEERTKFIEWLTRQLTTRNIAVPAI
jgi:hypothetical protein